FIADHTEGLRGSGVGLVFALYESGKPPGGPCEPRPPTLSSACDHTSPENIRQLSGKGRARPWTGAGPCAHAGRGRNSDGMASGTTPTSSAGRCGPESDRPDGRRGRKQYSGRAVVGSANGTSSHVPGCDERPVARPRLADSIRLWCRRGTGTDSPQPGA